MGDILKYKSITGWWRYSIQANDISLIPLDALKDLLTDAHNRQQALFIKRVRDPDTINEWVIVAYKSDGCWLWWVLSDYYKYISKLFTCLDYAGLGSNGFNESNKNYSSGFSIQID